MFYFWYIPKRFFCIRWYIITLDFPEINQYLQSFKIKLKITKENFYIKKLYTSTNLELYHSIQSRQIGRDINEKKNKLSANSNQTIIYICLIVTQRHKDSIPFINLETQRFYSFSKDDKNEEESTEM